MSGLAFARIFITFFFFITTLCLAFFVSFCFYVPSSNGGRGYVRLSSVIRRLAGTAAVITENPLTRTYDCDWLTKTIDSWRIHDSCQGALIRFCPWRPKFVSHYLQTVIFVFFQKWSFPNFNVIMLLPGGGGGGGGVCLLISRITKKSTDFH